MVPSFEVGGRRRGAGIARDIAGAVAALEGGSYHRRKRRGSIAIMASEDEPVTGRAKQ